MICCLAKRQARTLHKILNGEPGEFRRRIQAGSNRRSSERQLIYSVQGSLDSFRRSLHLSRVPAELIAQEHRHGVLKMRASDFDNVPERRSLFGKAV